ncbi:MAG: 5-(carboxyamino)imidazole ribonucleotide synthase [Flavobacteriales bacterium]|nr:5-(carboxyamino)imidazole ribonucleotide synthase [Flavobacteriales bacterium]
MAAFYSKDFTLGVLGGGQLGRMLIQEAIDLDVKVHVLDPDTHAPCAAIAHQFTRGSFADEAAVLEFGRKCDVLTVEIEHVHTGALRQLEAEGIKVYPTPEVLSVVQDKGEQKLFYKKHGIPTAPFHLIDNAAQLSTHVNNFPAVQKLRKGGYDGKGVQVLHTATDLEVAFDAPSVLENKIEFEKEISVIVARNVQGEVSTFPLVEMEFNPQANLVEFLFSPADVSPRVEERARQIAVDLVAALEHVGLLAVEMFVAGEEIWVNEIAPRPHNSGHHTIEANVTSQYAQHLRAILGLPLGDTRLVQPAVMVNLLGAPGHEGPVHYEGLETVLGWPGVHVHLYGKSTTKPFRKMGHVTVTSATLAHAQQLARNVLATVRVVS